MLVGKNDQPLAVIHKTDGSIVNIEHRNSVSEGVVLQQRNLLLLIPVDGQFAIRNILGVGLNFNLRRLDVQFNVFATFGPVNIDTVWSEKSSLKYLYRNYVP